MGKVALTILVWLIIGAVFTVIGAFITQLAWGWVVPDIFSGMVAEKLFPATLTLWQAFKLSILMVILVGGSRVSSSDK